MYVEFHIHLLHFREGASGVNMKNTLEILAGENIVPIRELQKNPSACLQGITRIVKGTKTLGFFFAKEEIDQIFEGYDFTRFPSFKRIIAESSVGKKRSVSTSLQKAYNQKYEIDEHLIDD